VLLGCFLAPGEDTLTVRGIVLTDAGVPIAGASVELLYREPFSSYTEGIRLAVTETGADGRYTITLGPPRTHDTSGCSSLLIAVEVPGYTQVVPHGVGDNGGATCQEGTTEVGPIRLVTLDG
jgi:hypothetical protein